jgi:hypothetical protein
MAERASKTLAIFNENKIAEALKKTKFFIDYSKDGYRLYC